jgi:hypothetical protein
VIIRRTAALAIFLCVRKEVIDMRSIQVRKCVQSIIIPRIKGNVYPVINIVLCIITLGRTLLYVPLYGKP